MWVNAFIDWIIYEKQYYEYINFCGLNFKKVLLQSISVTQLSLISKYHKKNNTIKILTAG